jgi:hypothetical protein
VTISSNHGHVLTIPVADLDSPTFKTYSIAGAAGHDHTVTLLPSQLQQIKAGTAVTMSSSTDGSPAYGAHFHNVTMNCS